MKKEKKVSKKDPCRPKRHGEVSGDADEVALNESVKASLVSVYTIFLILLKRSNDMANRSELNAAIGSLGGDVDSAVKEVTDAFARIEAGTGNGTPLDFQPEIDALSALHTKLGDLIAVAKGKAVTPA